MSGSRGLAVYGYALLAAVFSAAAGAQGWAPQRNVEIMVPNAQGSSLDTSARIVHKDRRVPGAGLALAKSGVVGSEGDP